MNEGFNKELNKELYCCRGKRMANYLLDNHCKLVKIDCDKNAKGYLVFLFIKNRNLINALETWQEDKDNYLI